jgi:hypothetical protein
VPDELYLARPPQLYLRLIGPLGLISFMGAIHTLMEQSGGHPMQWFRDLGSWLFCEAPVRASEAVVLRIRNLSSSSSSSKDDAADHMSAASRRRIRRQRARSLLDDDLSAADATFNLLLLVSFTVFTGMVSAGIEFFDCQEYEDGKVYLVVDPSVLCTSDQYLRNRPIIAVLVTFVLFGFPYGFYRILRSEKARIKPLLVGQVAVMGSKIAADNSLPHDQRKCARLISGLVTVLPEVADQIETSTDAAECSAFVRRAFDIQRKSLNPTEANWWMQTIYRGDDNRILHSKFLWGPYQPDYYWFEILVCARCCFLLRAARKRCVLALRSVRAHMLVCDISARAVCCCCCSCCCCCCSCSSSLCALRKCSVDSH